MYLLVHIQLNENVCSIILLLAINLGGQQVPLLIFSTYKQKQNI